MSTSLLHNAVAALALLALADSCRSTDPGTELRPAATTAAMPTANGSKTFVPGTQTVDPSPVTTGATRAEVGEIAPDFELRDVNGRAHRLSQYRGKIVVLEWFDPQCPFVTYAYDDGPLTEMRTRYAAAGIAWLGVYSTNAAHAAMAPSLLREFAERRKLAAPILIDADGSVGKLYAARTTPHMFVINNRGLLVYSGALDNAPRGIVERAAGKTNYVDSAIEDLRSGHAVTISSTRPYGSAILYSKP